MPRWVKASVWRHPALRWALLLSAMILFSTAVIDLPLARALEGPPDWVTSLFLFINRFGKSDWYLWPSGLLALAFGLYSLRRTAGRKTVRLCRWLAGAATYVFAAVAVPGLLVNILKIAIGRARPRLLYSDGLYGFFPFNLNADFHAFPSGHGQTAFCAAFALGSFWPSVRPALLAAAGVVASARLFLGAHYLSDVLASILLSLLAVYWMRRALEKRGLLFRDGGSGRRGLPAEGRWWARRVRKALFFRA